MKVPIGAVLLNSERESQVAQNRTKRVNSSTDTRRMWELPAIINHHHRQRNPRVASDFNAATMVNRTKNTINVQRIRVHESSVYRPRTSDLYPDYVIQFTGSSTILLLQELSSGSDHDLYLGELRRIQKDFWPTCDKERGSVWKTSCGVDINLIPEISGGLWFEWLPKRINVYYKECGNLHLGKDVEPTDPKIGK